ncbi:pre-toxin TG domain-containing protein [Weissella tructae]|uniref:Pre-toxin TG domain-containing protein n=2 Tax=Weissella TaxID=46255 RepID=A0A075TYV6_9LACO|nr:MULTISPECIES: pre-toxin TG domain-containing protein [Weissella]AIG65486.1 hypothetical protein WS08_0547 [Weissella tructae]AIM62800.1 hypothetical protein WS74_0548 [Weissella ceti]ELA07055.1 hypothetical protein WCNC_05727 [Weissella ceti NC36]
MSKRFKKFLKHFNISMVVVLFISSFGVLPSALTAEQVHAAEKVLNNGQYQQKVGSAEVYDYGKDTNPRQQQKTTVDYSREGSPREIPQPEPVRFWKSIKKATKSIGRAVSKPFRAAKKWVAPKPKPRYIPKPAPRRWSPPRAAKRWVQKVAPKWKAPKRKAPKKQAPKRKAPKKQNKKKQNKKKKAPKKQNKKKAKPKKKKRPSLMSKAKKKANNLKKKAKSKVKNASKNVKKAAKSVKKAAKSVKKGAVKGFKKAQQWTKKNKGKFIKAGDVVGDFLGLKDGYAVITGKDWSTGKKVSRVKSAGWLLVGFTPMGKAAKGAKIAGKGFKAARAGKKANKAKKAAPKRKSSPLKKGAKFGKKLKKKITPKKKSSKKKAPKKKNSALQAGNRAQRRAANKKGHKGSKKNKDKVNQKRQKQNKAAKQQRKNTKNAKSKKRNSPLKKSNSKAKNLKKKNSKPKKKSTKGKVDKLSPKEINNMSFDELWNSVPVNQGWTRTNFNGRVHIRRPDGTFRVRIDPPDKITKYQHMHVYNKKEQLLDIKGNVVDKNSPAGHIRWNHKVPSK